MIGIVVFSSNDIPSELDARSMGSRGAPAPAADALLDAGPSPTEGPEGYLLRLGRLLHATGAPSYRIEDALTRAARRLGLFGQFFSTPTSLFAAFGRGESQRTFLQRVEPGDIDLGRMSDLDELLESSLDPSFTLDVGRARLAELEHPGPRYAVGLDHLAFGLASAAAAVFFGGSAADVAVSGVLGLLTAVLGRALSGSPLSSQLFQPLSAFLAAFVALVYARVVPGASDSTITLASLIVLIPGLTVTVGLGELATTHWASGTARLAGASVVFLTMGVGVALGRQVGSGLLDWAVERGLDGLPLGASAGSLALPPWSQLLALIVAPVTFAVLFRARRRDIPVILLAGVIAFLGARGGTALFGPELGVFVGALLVGCFSNLHARGWRRPASVTQVPGLILLVPGSSGFQSVSSFVAQDVLLGVEAAFRMLLIGAALVGGMLLSNALVSPRRSL